MPVGFTRKRIRHQRISATALGCLLVCACGYVYADNRVVEQLKMGECQQNDTGTYQRNADIQLTVPMQLAGFSRSADGLQLQINLIKTSPDPKSRILVQEPIPALEPLTNAFYLDDNRRSGHIELTFSEPHPVQVSTTDDFQNLHLTIGCSPADVVHPQAENLAVELQAYHLMQQAYINLFERHDAIMAADLYQQVLALPAHSQKAGALEYLGLALERQGKEAEAVSRYQEYLRLYPAGEDHNRIQQHLHILEASMAANLPDLNNADATPRPKERDTFGSLEEIYKENRINQTGSPGETLSRGLYSNLDWQTRQRSSSGTTTLRLNGGRYHSYLGADDDDYSRISRLYLEYQNQDNHWSLKAGRMTSQQDGTLARYDGIRLGYAIRDTLNIHMVGGHPVATSRDALDFSGRSDRTLAGMSVDIGPWQHNNSKIGLSVYAIQQNNLDMVDRRAIGTELRYFRTGLSMLGLIDYDLLYRDLNIGTLLANWVLANQTTLSATLDVRKQPLLTSLNAIIGQTDNNGDAITSIRQLQDRYSHRNIYQLAKKRTSRTRSLGLGIAHPFSDALRWNTDLSLTNTNATQASAGVEATDATGNQLYITSQLISNGFFSEHSLSTTGIRASNTGTIRSYGVFCNSRLYAMQNWRLYPALSLDEQQWIDGSQQQFVITPHLRTDYQLNKLQLNAEFRNRWSNTRFADNNDGPENNRRTSISAGVRYDF
jgi:hypothetical protein